MKTFALFAALVSTAPFVQFWPKCAVDRVTATEVDSRERRPASKKSDANGIALLLAYAVSTSVRAAAAGWVRGDARGSRAMRAALQ